MTVDPHKILSARGTRTQRQFAIELGVDQAQVSRWERGEAEPNLISLANLSQLTGHPIDWFLKDNGKDAAA